MDNERRRRGAAHFTVRHHKLRIRNPGASCEDRYSREHMPRFNWGYTLRAWWMPQHRVTELLFRFNPTR